MGKPYNSICPKKRRRGRRCKSNIILPYGVVRTNFVLLTSGRNIGLSPVVLSKRNDTSKVLRLYNDSVLLKKAA